MKMEVLIDFAGGLLVLLVSIFVITYIIDRQNFNKGICPKCSKPLTYRGKDGMFHTYWCTDTETYHVHVAVVGNPYLNWRYGRKIRKKVK